MANNADLGLLPDLMSKLDDCLHRNNQFFALYKTAHEHIALLEQENATSLTTACVRLHFSESTDGRRYNLPSTEEVAVILPGPGEATDYRDIILQHRAGPLKRIHETNPAYVPLHYVLLFPRGELGWYCHIKFSDSWTPRQQAAQNNSSGSENETEDRSKKFVT